jgi:glycerol-3-phosphate dehydrogenase
MTPVFDIVVVGAGVVGTAIARDLSRFELRVAILEARPDFGDESSKGNSALMTEGIEIAPDSLEYRLVQRGYARYMQEAPALGLPFRKVGAVTLAWTDEQCAILEEEFERVRALGHDDFHRLDAAEVYRRWPNFGPGIRMALWAPQEAIADPFSTPYAYVLDAVENGVEFRHSWPVSTAERINDGWELRNKHGERVHARLIINAAGLRADVVEGLAGFDDFTMRPRRGQYLVLDKAARAIHDVIAMPTPSPKGRGILITPTIFGNVLVGPTAEDVEDRDDRATTPEGLAQLRAAMAVMVPALANMPVNTAYAGMRPATNRSDYQIIPRFTDRWLTVAGIRSTGFSGALGIAEHVAGLIVPEVFDPARKTSVRPVGVPDLSEPSCRPWQDNSLIENDPAYAEMLCHCERISVGEVRDALAAPIPPQTLKGLKRRTRVMFGRCQGFYCGARVQAMFEGRPKR